MGLFGGKGGDDGAEDAAAEEAIETAVPETRLLGFIKKNKENRAAKKEARFGERESDLGKQVRQMELEEKEEEYKAKKRSRTWKKVRFWFIVIFVIVFSIYAVWLLIFSKMGSGIGGTGITSARTGIFNMFTGAESEFNIGKQILTGQYDPTQLWSSQTYQDKYSTQTTARGPGIYITRLEPLRNPFPTGSTLVIFGQMEAESITGEQLEIYIFATGDEGSWTCEPGSIRNQRVFAGRFQCESNYVLTADAGRETADRVVVFVDYDFKVVGGKQIFVANANELDAIWVSNQDPLVYYGVSSDATASWSTPGSVEMGIKVAGLDEDIIPANDYDNTIASYLEIKVHNRGDGNATLKKYIVIQIPENIDPVSGTDTDFDYAPGYFCDGKFVGTVGDDLSTYVCNGKLSVLPACNNGICTYIVDVDGTTIDPGMAQVYYFKFKATEADFLSGAPVSSFFALAEVDYSYNTKMATTVTAKNISGAQ